VRVTGLLCLIVIYTPTGMNHVKKALYVDVFGMEMEQMLKHKFVHLGVTFMF
jgi:hypothetical protein